MQTPLLTTKQRIRSIDTLRGITMIVMALDHVRDFYTNAPFDPLDLAKTTPWLFLTRWITHFCAPIFVFLSGVSAYLSLSKKSSKNVAAGFLLKRGIWLLFVEFAVITFALLLDPGHHLLFAQVIWAIACSMLFLALLIWLNLKPVVIGGVGIALIFGHNLLDGIKADSLGNYKLIWLMLHEQGFYQLTKTYAIFILYPVVPWIGVMALGYYFGTLFKLDAAVRKPLFIKIGAGAIALFLVLRGFNIYGDPIPWHTWDAWWKNILAFVDCRKYPPSLLYLLMTLGPAMIALAYLENIDNALTRIFTTYGRVPFFYYVPHFYIIHISQVIIALSLGFTEQNLRDAGAGNPGKWGFGLPVIYLIWLLVVASLYFPCRWFMKVKQRRTDWWLSYL